MLERRADCNQNLAPKLCFKLGVSSTSTDAFSSSPTNGVPNLQQYVQEGGVLVSARGMNGFLTTLDTVSTGSSGDLTTFVTVKADFASNLVQLKQVLTTLSYRALYRDGPVLMHVAHMNFTYNETLV